MNWPGPASLPPPPPPALLPVLLGAAAAHAPEASALLAPGRLPMTYAHLLRQVTVTTKALSALGVCNRDRVAVSLPPGAEMAAACLAVAATAACAPLNPAFRAAEYDVVLGDLGPRVMLAQEGIDSPARAVARARGILLVEVVPLPHAEAGTFALRCAERGAPAPRGDPEPGDVALVLHTSGTTSRPKQVPLSHANLCASARNMADSLTLAPRDRCLDVMPLFHIHGLMALLASLAAGGGVICTPAFDPAHFFAWMDEGRPTWYTAVPTMHQAVLEEACRHHETVARHGLRFLRSASAPLPTPAAQELERTFRVPAIEAYGMTEAAHQIASNPLPPARRKAGSVGRPTGTEVAVMDEVGRLLPPGATGEIVIRGPNVTAGYLDDPAANAAAFTDGWLRTGDQGHMDPDGYVFLTGRLKDLINRGGEKIAPREVDEALLEHPAVVQAAAFAVPHPTLGEDVAAVVVLRPGAAATEGDLRDAAARNLAESKVPRQILVRDEIPKGATGKVQRRGLAAALGLSPPWGAPTVARPATTPPASGTQVALAEIWEKVLGLAAVGLGDNFFALGGDSLRAVRVLTEIERRLGRRLPPATLLRAPTIEALVGLLEASVAPAPWSPFVPLQPGGAGSPLYCVHQHTGQLFCYRDLARHLAPDHPVVGLAAQGLEDGQVPASRIEDMAARYVQAIRTRQPVGPYCLAGYCFGGTVAFEMAQQLLAQGQAVALLAMIQTSWVVRRAAVRGWIHVASQRARFERENLARRPPGQRLPYVLERAAIVVGEAAGRTVARATERVRRGRPQQSPIERAIRAVDRAHGEALRRYTPRTYPGRVVLFRSARLPARFHGDPFLGWGGLAGGGIEVHEIASDRPTVVEEPPVRLLAEKLRGCLQAAQAARGAS